jgi:hypothetical protein
MLVMSNEKDSRAANGIDNPHDYLHYIEAPSISQDLVIGADDGAKYLFGEADRRRFYHLVSTSRLPTARLGSKIAIQKSVIRSFLWQQQRRAFANDNVEALIRLRLLALKFLELFRLAESHDEKRHDPNYVQLAYAAIELAKTIRVLTDKLDK